MRQQGNVPSSVISSHSMHLGVLATAWHAVLTGTMFTVYYKPRYEICFKTMSALFQLLSDLSASDSFPSAVSFTLFLLIFLLQDKSSRVYCSV